MKLQKHLSLFNLSTQKKVYLIIGLIFVFPMMNLCFSEALKILPIISKLSPATSLLEQQRLIFEPSAKDPERKNLETDLNSYRLEIIQALVTGNASKALELLKFHFTDTNKEFLPSYFLTIGVLISTRQVEVGSAIIALNHRKPNLIRVGLVKKVNNNQVGITTSNGKRSANFLLSNQNWLFVQLATKDEVASETELLKQTDPQFNHGRALTDKEAEAMSELGSSNSLHEKPSFIAAVFHSFPVEVITRPELIQRRWVSEGIQIDLTVSPLSEQWEILFQKESKSILQISYYPGIFFAILQWQWKGMQKSTKVILETTLPIKNPVSHIQFNTNQSGNVLTLVFENRELLQELHNKNLFGWVLPTRGEKSIYILFAPLSSPKIEASYSIQNSL